MKKPLTGNAGRAHALLRIVAGFNFACHGVYAVYLMVTTGTPYSPTWLYGAAGIVEFVTGPMILFGYRVRLAALLASGQMAVAYFYAHQKDGLLPFMNQGELAMTYCFVFLFLAAAGAGPWSLDRLSRR